MSTESDDLLKSLYQQRKNQVVAPKVNLSQISNKPPVRDNVWGRLVIALVGGSFASFGILAVISHLAELPEETKNQQPIITQQASEVEFQQDDESLLAQQAVEKLLQENSTELPKLTPVPKRTAMLVKSYQLPLPKIDENDLVKHFNLTIKQPEIKANITLQVMPEYPTKAVLDGRNGYVRLSYQVLPSGKVDTIKVLASDGHRDMQKSAIDALAKWHYKMNEQQRINSEIVFEFKLPPVEE